MAKTTKSKKTKKLSTKAPAHSAPAQVVEVPKGAVPMLKIGDIEIPLTAEQFAMLSAKSMPAPPPPTPAEAIPDFKKEIEPRPKATKPKASRSPPATASMPAPRAAEPTPAPIAQTTLEPVPKVSSRRPGQLTINVPTRQKRINTAKVTRTGGYHRLRYHLEFLEEKWKKRQWDTKTHEARLVAALKAFSDSLGDSTRDLVEGVLRILDREANLTDATAKAVSDFRQKHLRGGR